MAYQAWSVVAGEQPSAAKWNILGSNDASFNDGTGIATNAITGPKLSTNALLLGYMENVTSATMSSETPAALAGVTVAVTIPAGGRSVKITGYAPNFRNNNAAGAAFLQIWDGTVGSGTLLNECEVGTAQTANNRVPAIVQRVVTPAAGAKTYNLGWRTNGTGTAAYTGATTNPLFLLVELI